MITRPIVIIDGVVQDSADAHVSIADAAFSIGEGILETMLAVDGQIVREARHRARAQRGLQLLGIDGFDWGAATRKIADVTSKAQIGRARVRLIISRGELSGGFGGPAIDGPKTVVTLHHAAPLPDKMIATVIDWPRRSGGGLNVEFKSLGYANERYARKRAEAAGCDIAILLSEQSFVACADTANVFILSGDMLLTPPTRDGALRGTVREQILEFGPSVGFEVREASFTVDELRSADAVLVSNSGLGLFPLTEIKWIWRTSDNPDVKARIDRLRNVVASTSVGASG